MQVAPPSKTAGSGDPPSGSFPELFSDAIRFWEPLRIFYNLVLIAITLLWLVATWPHFRVALTLTSLGQLVIFGLIANICYCAAYLADIPIQHTSFGIARKHRRWILWSIGTLFAIVLANYWIADEIYPYVH
jgi:hypothetical protein